MNGRRWLAAIWLCFVLRGLFYCAGLPLWEGFDEWSHFGVVQRMAFRGEWLVSRESPAPQDTAASLDLVPLAWELRNFGPPTLTHDGFWQLPPEARAQREAAFRALPSALAMQDSAIRKTYEGLQGPLYGWIMSPVLRVARHAHLATQLLLLRCFGMLLASLAVPFAFLACRRAFGDTGLGLGCAAVVAAMPGIMIDVAHVSNEPVAVMLFAALICLSVEMAERGPGGGRALAVGVVLGLGLLAKAYFLTAVPVVAAIVLWQVRRDWRSVLAPAAAGVVAGWWYVRNLLTTGAVSGMWESATLPHAGMMDQVAQIPKIHWGVVVDSILFSHLWLGSWSTLTVRSWMYHALYLVIAVAAVGLMRRGWMRSPAFATIALYFGFFWLGQLYHTITLFMVWGIATTLGAYLCAIATTEVALCTLGLRAIVGGRLRPWVLPFGVLVFAALDFYSMHFVALPYYAGFTAHKANGALATFHLNGVSMGDWLTRLAAFKAVGAGTIGVVWAASIAATLGLIGIAVAVARREPRP